MPTADEIGDHLQSVAQLLMGSCSTEGYPNCGGGLRQAINRGRP